VRQQTQPVKKISVIDLFHRLAVMFRPVMPKLIDEYSMAEARHADDTSWGTDGALAMPGSSPPKR
jgi:hypothetical protein